jgi:hypothetical protein
MDGGCLLKTGTPNVRGSILSSDLEMMLRSFHQIALQLSGTLNRLSLARYALKLRGSRVLAYNFARPQR